MCDGFSFIDLDHVGAATPAEWACNVVDRLGGYCEWSPSGQGLHIFAAGTVPTLKKRLDHSAVEIYSEKRFATVTGDTYRQGGLSTADLLQFRQDVERGRVGPNAKPRIIAEQFDSQRYRDIVSGDYVKHGLGRSEAVQSALVTLAMKHKCDQEKMRDEFENTALCEDWEHDGKWARLGDKEIEKAIAFVKANDAKNALPIIEVGNIAVPSEDVPRLVIPPHDYLDKLAVELSYGTIIPFAYCRELLKLCALAALPDSRPQLSWFPDLHTRMYVFLLSEAAGSGKGESWKRVRKAVDTPVPGILQAYPSLLPANGFAAETLESVGRLAFHRGEAVGSAEFAVRLFGGQEVHAAAASPSSSQITSGPIIAAGYSDEYRHIVDYDEGAKLLQKDSSGEGGRGLVTMYTSLFESNGTSAGSIKNKHFQVDRADVSMTLAFTRDGFHRNFTGSGTNRDGFLSRCVMVYDRRDTVDGDWRVPDPRKTEDLLREILTCLTRTTLPEDSGVEEARQDAIRWINRQDPNTGARLIFHFAQDLYARSVFSPEGRITTDAVERSRKWIEHQLLTRAALWPVDVSRDRVETMTTLLRKAYENHRRLTHRQARKFAHAHRPGSGGEETYFRAHRALLNTGAIVKVGATRKGSDVFELGGEL